jgi:MoaA/NifB/PqqE/SkfB family radical SAM enzyme
MSVQAAPVKFGFPDRAHEAFPQTIVLETTNVCNLRCIHCPQGQGYPDRADYKPEYIEWGVFTKAIDEIAQHRISLLRISPAGEALVHPQFLDQIAYMKSKGVGPVDLTTNGLTLDNQAIENGQRIPGTTIMDRLVELGLEVMDISLDAATKEAYERIRVGSNYHRVWANIHRLLQIREQKKAPLKVMLSIIDQPEAKGEVEKFVDYWTPLVDRVIVRPYLPNLGLTGRKPGDIVDRHPNLKRWPCPQFWKRITISTEGHIRFCVVDWLNETVLGNVRTHSIAELWRSAEYDRMRGCHMDGKYSKAHGICGPCTDWMGMRWDWGFDMAIRAAFGDKTVPDKPRPVEEVYGDK